MVFLMLPILSHLGYGLNWREAIVLAWGGLRGAVGLALALFVSLDNQIADARFTTLTFFYIAAIVLLTLLIQGTTTPLLLQVCFFRAGNFSWSLRSAGIADLLLQLLLASFAPAATWRSSLRCCRQLVSWPGQAKYICMATGCINHVPD